MYLVLKLIHVAAVIIFLGNIITGLFWKAHADRTRDVRFIAHTMHGIIRSDRWFTIPGVVVITLAGFLAAIQVGPACSSNRLDFLVTRSLQRFGNRIRVARCASAETDPGAHHEYERQCVPLGSVSIDVSSVGDLGFVATLSPIIAVALMVLKRPV